MSNTDQHPTKTRILDTAARLFHEQGYNATGVATILREAGVNSGSLYHYFPSKDDVLVGVLEHYTHLMHPVVMQPVESATSDPIERVFKLLANYRQMLVICDFRLGCPIGNLALEVGDDNAPARELINRNFNNWIGVVAGWLADAGDRLPARLNRRDLAAFVLTTMEGGIMQARASRTLDPYDVSVAQLRAYFDALEAEAARAHPPNSRNEESPCPHSNPPR